MIRAPWVSTILTGVPAGRYSPRVTTSSRWPSTSPMPAGIGEVDGHRLDVVTRGEYLPAGTPVRIVETHGARIIVEEKT